MSSKSIHVQLRVLAGVGSVEQGNYKGSTTVSELLASHPGHDLIMDHKLMVCVPSVGTRFAVSISWDDTATDIKRKIEELAKLSAEHQVLSADGVIFEGDERLLATMSDMARPSINLEVKGASEGEESEPRLGALPDRFMIAVQAIRGDFSPPDDEPDDERQEDLIFQALTDFPATVQLKVVSRAVPEEQLDSLVKDVAKLCECVDATDAAWKAVRRGSRRSIALSIRVPSALALAELRDALVKDPRVQMVF
ncbi:hypothetical protein AB1Y20_019683 [Prymnesium parvum]|uniref:Ubiquitin-like domain-containing protein n=1 Tax=Prymnesium parvum TaxID=97485 RepID=A0AB34JUU0_PRYPA